MKGNRSKAAAKTAVLAGYDSVLTGVADLLETARRASVRTTNAIMTATYWEIGRRIVEYEQKGQARAEYGRQLVDRLAADLTENSDAVLNDQIFFR